MTTRYLPAPTLAADRSSFAKRRATLTLMTAVAFGVAGRQTAHAAIASAADTPAVMLANVYRGGVRLADYRVSEKFDGVRGWWDGHSLRTRNGRRIHSPAWFTAGWPAIAIDGELWAGRGRFEFAAAAIAADDAQDDEHWRSMRFMAFDLPQQAGSFDERLPVLQALVGRLGQPWAEAVVQNKVDNEPALASRLRQIVSAGGEGLMLHRGASMYRGGRSDDLLKLKTYLDAEARVVAWLPGVGRNQGRMGALLVETPQGQRFRLGTGFNDALRNSPPPVGAVVTYRHTGLTAHGTPRFASFMRVAEWPAGSSALTR